jgi:hypothetical protein
MLGEKATFAQLVGPPCALTSSGGKVPVQAAKQKKNTNQAQSAIVLEPPRGCIETAASNPSSN